MPQVTFTQLIALAQRGDRLLSFPTDTVPALAVRPDRAELIFTAKQRQKNKPLILMGASIEDLLPYVQGSETDQQIWQTVMNCHWPGALTLVLPASDRLPRAMNPTDPTTIGIRIPDHNVARYILAQTGPLATTSANRSGQPPLTTIADIEAQFPDVITLLPAEMKMVELDGQSVSSVPSTVAKWTGERWEILRQGKVRL